MTAESELPAGHRWVDESRYLIHNGGHSPLHVPFPAKFIQNKARMMGRVNGLLRSVPSRAYD